MKERPINFKAWEVRAIIEGRKTQFRRAVKDTGLYAIDAAIHGQETATRELIALATRCPFGQPGDRLWVRETLLTQSLPGYPPAALYRADGHSDEIGPWTPSVQMPRWASRIDLELVSRRVERLVEISEEDAKAEGTRATLSLLDSVRLGAVGTHREGFLQVWESDNGHGSWAENPFVWVVEFRLV